MVVGCRRADEHRIKTAKSADFSRPNHVHLTASDAVCRCRDIWTLAKDGVRR